MARSSVSFIFAPHVVDRAEIGLPRARRVYVKRFTKPQVVDTTGVALLWVQTAFRSGNFFGLKRHADNNHYLHEYVA
jgi:hypothetical protein